MQIVCPACASAYEVPTERMGSEGRSVRCASCRETWFITADDVAAAQIAEAMAAMGDGSRNRSEDQAALDAWEAALADEGVDPAAPPAGAVEAEAPLSPPLPPAGPAAKRRGKAPGRRAGRPRKLGPLAWGAGACLGLVAASGVAVAARGTVVRAMPQSASLYASLGLAVNLRGIDLRDVVAFASTGEGGIGQLVVEGDLVGVAREAVAVPAIEIEVRDGRDQPLYRWSVPAPRRTLDTRERARFRASLSAPPAQARSVRVRFSDVQAAAAEASPKADASGRRP